MLTLVIAQVLTNFLAISIPNTKMTKNALIIVISIYHSVNKVCIHFCTHHNSFHVETPVDEQNDKFDRW